MMLAEGARIGPYEIAGWLGAGGMGEVYRARDPRLDRAVAIKLLPESFAADADRLRRFEQEARAAGQLNHPNILTVYDVGTYPSTSSGHATPYVVSELLEGMTLRARLQGGAALAPRRAIDYARQIADGLAAAHDRGIVHRDLKPDNLFVTGDGRIKILDFGLAKLTRPRGDSAPHAGLPTETEPGMVIGTAAYMSPEQVRGEAVDHRSDIFGLGVILYEMLAGRPAFTRATAAETMTAILKEDPPELPAAMVPPALARLVGHCLEKPREGRFQSARDLGFHLESVPEATAAGPAISVPAAPRRRRTGLVAAAAIAALVIAAAIVLWRLDRSDYFWRNPLDDAHFTRLTDFDGTEYDAAISADGRFAAFVSDRSGVDDVWVTQIGTGEFHNLTAGRISEIRGSSNQNVGFSRDGSLVWMHNRPTNPDDCPGAQNTIWVAPTLGGNLRPFLQCAAHVDWTADGRRMVYVSPTAGDPMFVAEADDKVGRRIFVSRPGVHSHFQTWSPDGRFIYFVHGVLPDELDLWRMRPEGGEPERLTFHQSLVRSPTFLDNRVLLYSARAADGSGPWLYGMDVERRVPHRVSFGVEQYTSIDASADGSRLLATVATGKAGLWRIPLSEKVIEESDATRVHVPNVHARSPRLGPNYLLYLSSKGAANGLWKLQDGAATELWSGLNGAVMASPAVSPDGRTIAFPVRRGGRTKLYVMGADATGARVLGEALDINGAPSWSPDGKWIAVAAGQGANARVYRVPADGAAPVPLVTDYSVDPIWSPDGTFLVYAGPNVSSTFQVKAATADGAPRSLPSLVLPRGTRFRFVPGQNALLVLKGWLWTKDFYIVDLETGRERQVTKLHPDFTIHDFDLSADGRAITFDRLKETSDIVLIDLPKP